MDNAPPYVIEMLHITKEFPGIKANDDITLQLKKGEIHALLGENGAGKSTLMSVLFGLYQPEAGEIRKNGKPVKIDNPNDATALGIGMVHQHFKLIDVFTVLDNIILGAETTKLGFIQRKEARKKVEELSEKYGLKVDLDAKVEDITVGMQQRVEILKMLYRDNEILIFDEPTAVLTPQETDKLFAVLRSMRDDGKAIVIESPEEVDKLDFNRDICLYSQTTKPLEGFRKIVEYIGAHISPTATFRYYDTICRQVANRMPHIRDFATRHDVILFVCGKKSSNGKVLYDECRSVNPRSYLVDAASEIDFAWLEDCRSVGICGATSTPKWLMEECAEAIRKRMQP